MSSFSLRFIIYIYYIYIHTYIYVASRMRFSSVHLAWMFILFKEVWDTRCLHGKSMSAFIYFHKKIRLSFFFCMKESKARMFLTTKWIDVDINILIINTTVVLRISQNENKSRDRKTMFSWVIFINKISDFFLYKKYQ